MKFSLQITRKKPYNKYMANFCMSVVTDRYVAFLYLPLAVAGSLHKFLLKYGYFLYLLSVLKVEYTV